MSTWRSNELIKVLNSGGVAVMPTDTIYGVVGSALNPETVERIYKIKKRNPQKPFIVLLANREQGSDALELALEQIQEHVKTPTTFVVPYDKKKFEYLHRGKNSLAIRIPQNKDLQALLLKTGPLVAPSANPEALPPAKSTAEAKEYFGDQVDFYLDGGEVSGRASKILKLNSDGSFVVLRG